MVFALVVSVGLILTTQPVNVKVVIFWITASPISLESANANIKCYRIQFRIGIANSPKYTVNIYSKYTLQSPLVHILHTMFSVSGKKIRNFMA